MLKLGGERDEITVVSDQFGSPTFASDLAKALMHIISHHNFNKKSLQSEIFHFSNLGETSWSEFAMEIFKIGKIDCKVIPIFSEEYLTAASRPKNTTLSKEKITNQYKLKIPSWKQSLKECLEEII